MSILLPNPQFHFFLNNLLFHNATSWLNPHSLFREDQQSKEVNQTACARLRDEQLRLPVFEPEPLRWIDSARHCYITEALSALRACAYIYIQQLSSFRAPTLWFIDLTVATCHIQYTFLSLCQFVSRENGQNTKILEVRHFRMIRKWLPTVTRRAKH